MGTGNGFGKTILFGEHFVVYGYPAIASALGSSTKANIEVLDGSGLEIIDDRPATPGYKDKKFDEAQQAIQNVLNYCQIDTTKQKLKIHFAGDLYAASGVGASAAQVASLARALNEQFHLNMNDEKINEAAYEGEKAYHGTPSGIDNTAATYGGLIWFKKSLEGGKNTIDLIKSGKQMYLVIGNTGKTASTKEVVDDVRILKDKHPKRFEKIFNDFNDIVNKAKDALLTGDAEEVGRLMNLNHILLQEITVSCDEANILVGLARSKGALGAKMTGTGRGGLMIALAPDKETQDLIANAIEEKGFDAWKTMIG